MAKNKDILGIDLGGSFIKFGLVTNQGKLIKLKQITTPKTQQKIITSLIDLINLKLKYISGVGIGLPGLLDLKGEKILKTPNLPLTNVPIIKLLKQKIKLPIKIDNDANCFALAESIVGSGKNYPIVVGLTLGTGIGGGIVINKKIYHGRANAGEFGHQYINLNKPADLEDLIGAKKLKLKFDDYCLLKKQAQRKNKEAINFWKRFGSHLGFGLINLIYLLDPNIIILGGQQSKNIKLFYPSMKNIIKRYYIIKPPKIIRSKLINKAGVIGAALLFNN